MANWLEIAGMAAMAATPAATPAATVTDPATRATLLDSAREPVSAALGKPVLFRVRQLRHQGDWAFLLATMEERDGHPLDYAGTPKAEIAAQGYASHLYAALLHRTPKGWTVAANAIGPTDVAWADWAKRYGAPEAIFAD